jgi:hypothetical protein
MKIIDLESWGIAIIKWSFNHTYEHLPYNNWTNTRLANDVLCNTICYMTTNDSVRNEQLKFFKLITQI